ncbi:MAG: orotate phosphoribosyltransferase [Actinomycetota bacterium]|nr:orotate phosphoribosyltransferase [Actinomycetota bacterium]
MVAHRDELIDLVRRKGLITRDVADFRLSSGEWSRDYIDGKRALSDGADLALACDAVIACAAELGVEFDAVGGLTMGADPIAHGVALISGVPWFSVRQEPKRHGDPKLVEGAALSPGVRVLVVDDVTTTGSSILRALEAVRGEGAEVVAAIALVDRGEATRVKLVAAGVPYQPLLTYHDLEIEPVGGVAHAETAGL